MENAKETYFSFAFSFLIRTFAVKFKKSRDETNTD